MRVRVHSLVPQARLVGVDVLGREVNAGLDPGLLPLARGDERDRPRAAGKLIAPPARR
jgi:hypothetical protein